MGSKCDGGGCGGGDHHNQKKAGVAFPACGKCEESLKGWTEGEFLAMEMPSCPVCVRADISKTRDASPPPEMFIIQVGVSYPYDGCLTVLMGCPKGHRTVQKVEVKDLLSTLSQTIREKEREINWS